MNDLQLHDAIYNAAGGDPVLLLHGGLGSTLDWGNQVPELMKAHKVVALDSHAKLSPPPGAFPEFIEQISSMWFSQSGFKPKELAAITVPIVIADGQHEEPILPEHTTELALLIPGAKQVILSNVSHMAMWQDPAAINKAMMDFVEQR